MPGALIRWRGFHTGAALLKRIEGTDPEDPEELRIQSWWRTPGPKEVQGLAGRLVSSRLQYSSPDPRRLGLRPAKAPSLLELQPDGGPPTPLQLQLQRAKQHRDKVAAALCPLPSTPSNILALRR